MNEPTVVARTYKLRTKELVSEQRYTLNNVGLNRLARHLIWAAKNSMGVQTFNLFDTDKADDMPSV